jgi:hypothetical protein
MPELMLGLDGDEIECTNWQRLSPYVHRYEPVWRVLVAPLRAPNSIMFRNGIDEQFEEFGMCHYTTYVNLARALNKIEAKLEDFKFAEEIWANLHRAAEVASKAVDAFRKIYLECTIPRQRSKVNTSKLQALEAALKKYRNTLHGPMIGTAKRDGVRLLPRRERLDQYHRWTAIMYRQNTEDFIAVEELLWADFRSLCSVLQSVWGEILQDCERIVGSDTFVTRRAGGNLQSLASTTTRFGASGTIILPET